MGQSPTRRKIETLDVIVPIFNEGETIGEFHRRLVAVVDGLNQDARIIYVDDGSSDRTPAQLSALAARDPRVGVATLSRNFGQQAALTAGLSLADADAVLSIDGDGQNPAELIPEMIKEAEAGFDVVQTKRVGGAGAGWFKSLTSRFFYWFINLMSGTEIAPGVADFRLLTRPALDALRDLPEYHRFLRGMTPWIGFPATTLPYTVAPRLGGRSKYSLPRMLGLAADAMFSFTLRPLYLMVAVGALFILFAFAELIYVSSFWLRGLGHLLVPGWSSLMFVILFVGGTTMLSLGVTAMYVGYIFQEVKRRPVYVLNSYRKPSRRSKGKTPRPTKA